MLLWRNCYEEEIIKLQDEELIEEIGKVSNEKSTKESTKELIEESHNESDNESDKESSNEPNKENKSIEEMFEEIDKESEEEFIEDLKEAKCLNNKSTTDWYDKDKFNKILTTIDSSNFNHKIKIGKFRFNDINNLINNIKNNPISEADTKKKINELNEIKAELMDEKY